MNRTACIVARPNPPHSNPTLANRKTHPFKRILVHASRVMGPSLVALSIASIAHAQGTMDFSGAQTLMGTFKTTLLKSVRKAAEKRGYVVEGFAPTSRAANQLRDASISADTLQGFLVRPGQRNPDRHLYMIDESSLASTKQVRDFLAKLRSSDRVLLIGDTRQHQGVEAGKPFEQLVNAGMKTTQLDQIVRQRAAPELLKAVEHLSRGEVGEGVALLEQQGRVTEIADPQQRIAAIARSYAANPDNAIVVSPDNASRRQINQGCAFRIASPRRSRRRRSCDARARAAFRYDRSRPYLGRSLCREWITGISWKASSYAPS